MKPSIHKKSQNYLNTLESKREDPEYHLENPDAIDQLIYEKGLRIRSEWFDKELDLMVLLLNNRKLVQVNISSFPKLKTADETSLNNFENDGFGLHWPELDEDLSLKGFLTYELAGYGEKIGV